MHEAGRYDTRPLARSLSSLGTAAFWKPGSMTVSDNAACGTEDEGEAYLWGLFRGS